MERILNHERMHYLFGDQFNVSVAESALAGLERLPEIRQQLIEDTANGKIHTGIRLVSYLDVDTGLFMSVLQTFPGRPSIISFYADSKHRFFGGQTLVCVPFQFCLEEYKPEGDHIVYRHTFKAPSFEPDFLKKERARLSDAEFLKAVVFVKSRDAYVTVPGMSYVGLTQRSWQERYVEHTEKALEKDGSSLFHQAIRDMQGQPVIHVHDVSLFGATREQAKEYERTLIRESTLAPKGLNMKVG